MFTRLKITKPRQKANAANLETKANVKDARKGPEYCKECKK